MVSFADSLKDTDIPEVNEYGQYDGPPRVNWFNGVKSKHRSVPDVPGTFYVSEKVLGGLVPGDPWQRVERFKDEIGYEAEEVGVIFIARRSQPYRDIEEGPKRKRREWHARWMPGVSQAVYTEYLCYMDGFYAPDAPEEGTPVVWAMKGMVGKRVDDLLKEYASAVLGPAKRIASEQKGKAVKLPRWTFRLIVRPEQKGGAYVFTDTGHGSLVQLPTIPMPDKVDDAVLSNLYVGPALLTHLKAVYDEHDEWRTTMRDAAGGEAAQEDDAPVTQQTPQPKGSDYRVQVPNLPSDDDDLWPEGEGV